MEQAKASNLIFIREEFKRRGKDIEEKFLTSLNEEERKVYTDALAFSWVTISTIHTYF